MDEDSRLPQAEVPPSYRPPGIAWEEPFEMKANLASACGKVAFETSECSSFPAS